MFYLFWLQIHQKITFHFSSLCRIFSSIFHLCWTGLNPIGTGYWLALQLSVSLEGILPCIRAKFRKVTKNKISIWVWVWNVLFCPVFLFTNTSNNTCKSIHDTKLCRILLLTYRLLLSGASDLEWINEHNLFLAWHKTKFYV